MTGAKTGAGPGGGAAGAGELGVGISWIAPSSTLTPATLTNVCRRTPPTISHSWFDGRPRRTVPSLGVARRRPPPRPLIVAASTPTAPAQLPSTAQLVSWTAAAPATRWYVVPTTR